MNGIGQFLGAHPPFDASSEAALETVVDTARIADFAAGEKILDAFTAPANEVFVVLSGQVEVWNSVGAEGAEADEVLTSGDVFGFSAILSGTAIGPLAVALGPVRVTRIGADAVSPAFSSTAGAQFLVTHLGQPAVRQSGGSAYGIVDQLVVTSPVTIPDVMTIAEVARLMTASGSHYAVVTRPGGGFGLVTDALLRERVLAVGVSPDAPVSAAMIAPAPFVVTGTLAAQALLELVDKRSGRPAGHRPHRSVARVGGPGRFRGVAVDSGDVTARTGRPRQHRRRVGGPGPADATGAGGPAASGAVDR